jgi:hypothetical protein
MTVRSSGVSSVSIHTLTKDEWAERHSTSPSVAGDLTVSRGPGRTTNPKDFESLMNDIERKLFDRLPDETLVIPATGSPAASAASDCPFPTGDDGDGKGRVHMAARELVLRKHRSTVQPARSPCGSVPYADAGPV